MLTGMFKSFAELEESLTVEELREIITAKQDDEYRNWKFTAGLKGIDLDAETKSDQNGSFERSRRRADAKLRAMAQGKGEDEVEQFVETAEFAEFGITITKE